MKKFLRNWKNTFVLILSDQSVSQRTQKIVLGLILLACLTVRFYTIDTPKLDRTGWKEIDYIEISTNYWRHGYNFHQPTINLPAEPPRVTAMELPLVPFVAALLYPLFGFNVYSVRLITLVAFLVLGIYVFCLGKMELGPVVGLLAALMASIMPLYNPNYMFNRILYSDPLTNCFFAYSSLSLRAMG